VLAISAWSDEPDVQESALMSEYGVRLLGSLTTMGSPMDREKQQIDLCFNEAAKTIYAHVHGGDKQDLAEWTGTYTNSVSSITLSGAGESLSGTEKWATGGRHGNNTLGNCKVTGTTARCAWQGTYQGDPDKTAQRRGSVELTLSGSTLSGRYEEDEPTFQWNVTPYPSGIRKGAIWPFTATRQ
jgi:hypothetical protein